MGAEKLLPMAKAIVKRKSRAKTVQGTRVDKMPTLFKGKPGAYKAARDAKAKELVRKRKLKNKVVRNTLIGGTATAALVGAGGGKEDKKVDYTVGVSKGGVPFKKAFAKARADGKKTFMWNDKEYHTKLKSEVKKTTKAKKKRGILFGKDAKFRPFGGAIARALLGDDEKFGGDRGAIDFIRIKKKSGGGPVKKMRGGGNVTQGMRNTVKVPPPKGAWATPPKGTGGVKPSKSSSGLSKVQLSMLKQAQLHARDTGQNPKTLQDLVAKYGSQLKGGGRKGKAKGAPRPGGRRNGGEMMAPPLPRARPAPAAPAASGLSQAQQNLLRQAQQHSQSTGQNPAKLQALTAQHGNLMKPKQGRRAAAGARPNLPRPGGMKAGGSVGKPRGVGAATRGYGRAMKK